LHTNIPLPFFFLGLFFFSSRRRHTRFSRDWSSDVCSSDLAESSAAGRARLRYRANLGGVARNLGTFKSTNRTFLGTSARYSPMRSEERRVGKECRYRGYGNYLIKSGDLHIRFIDEQQVSRE